ncbi:MAG: response regulator [Proteobacteria bacterium]|nr:response regulator [Pseudomonadota bacterium]
MAYKFSEVTVLIVDSQPAIVELVRDVLRMLGVQQVLTCTNGASGLRAFEEYSPDIMIIDWDLDNIDGLSFTKAVRGSNNPYTPIIFMTALSSAKRVVAARDSGITEFLKKPFTVEALCQRIETIIEKPRPFVRAAEFIGPDRRRKRTDDLKGPDRRSSTSGKKSRKK